MWDIDLPEAIVEALRKLGASPTEVLTDESEVLLDQLLTRMSLNSNAETRVRVREELETIEADLVEMGDEGDTDGPQGPRYPADGFGSQEMDPDE